ncbi:MAG: hypothetical protein HFG27_12265 [Provencibacterium sp.]|jgi:hypothetical protein|nr:hypothetical protein [Provencibacterium sp.]
MVARKGGWLLCGLLLLACFCVPAYAAGELRVQLSGTRLDEKGCYASPVSITISGAQQGERILIKEDGRWMSLSSDEGGSCRLDFAEDGDYRLRFCAEAADGQRSGFTDAIFTIDQQTASFLESCRRLPDPWSAQDEQVIALEEELLALQRRENALDEAQRARIPAAAANALSELYRRLGQLRPQQDITPPQPPQVLITGAAAKNSSVYRDLVQLEILPPQTDFYRLWMRTSEEWELLEAVDGAYTLECSASDIYRYDFCSEDAAGNRSSLTRAELIISPGLFEFYEEVGRSTGLGVEKALRLYQLFDGRGCALVEEGLIRQLKKDYLRACEQTGFTVQADLNGRQLFVLGMLSGFYGRQGIQLKASEKPVEEEKTAAGKKLLWEYTLSLNDGQGNAVEPKEQLLVSVQLPSELLKKKNVAVVDADGKLLESHLRNEDEGFVLSFLVPGSGVYTVGAES